MCDREIDNDQPQRAEQQHCGKLDAFHVRTDDHEAVEVDVGVRRGTVPLPGHLHADGVDKFPVHAAPLADDIELLGSVVEVEPGQDEKSRIVTVKTLADKESVDNAVARCLDSFKLLGNRL